GRQDLLAIDGDVAGGLDADPDLVAIDLDDGDHDVVANHDLLVHFAAQDQHWIILRAVGRLIDPGSVRLSFATRVSRPFPSALTLCRERMEHNASVVPRPGFFPNRRR